MYLRIVCWLSLSLIVGCHQTTAEERAIEEVERLGGEVRRDGQIPGRPVTTVNLAQSKVTDGELQVVKRFPQLRILDLNRTRITDRGLEHLERMTNLRELRLDFTLITDAGLVRLEGLKELRKLSLNDTKVGGLGLFSLKSLSNLEQVSLKGSLATAKDMDHLREALPKAAISR